jgi:hypothetical protein
MTEREEKITEKLLLQVQSKLDAMMTNIKEELKAATSLELRQQHPRQTVIKPRALNPPNVRNEKSSKTTQTATSRNQLKEETKENRKLKRIPAVPSRNPKPGTNDMLMSVVLCGSEETEMLTAQGLTWLAGHCNFISQDQSF